MLLRTAVVFSTITRDNVCFDKAPFLCDTSGKPVEGGTGYWMIYRHWYICLSVGRITQKLTAPEWNSQCGLTVKAIESLKNNTANSRRTLETFQTRELFVAYCPASKRRLYCIYCEVEKNIPSSCQRP